MRFKKVHMAADFGQRVRAGMCVFVRVTVSTRTQRPNPGNTSYKMHPPGNEEMATMQRNREPEERSHSWAQEAKKKREGTYTRRAKSDQTVRRRWKVRRGK